MLTLIHLRPALASAALLLFAFACTQSSPCPRYAELSATCPERPEKREVSMAICKNAFEHKGEDDRSDSKRAAYVAELNETIRLQAECARKVQSCEDFAACRKLRADGSR